MKIQYLVLLASVIFMFGCNSHKAVTLNPVDSLGWQEEDEYYIGGATRIEADRENIYSLNALQNCVQVFNRKTLEYVGKFGSKGYGPGEFKVTVSFTVTDSGIYVYDLVQNKIELFSKQLEYKKGYKTDQFLVDIDSYQNEIYGLTDMRLPDTKLLKIISDRSVKIAEYDNLSQKLGYNPEESSILEFKCDIVGRKMYVTHMQVLSCGILENGVFTKIECEYPEWANEKDLHTMSIFATESGFMLIGSCVEDLEKTHSFAFEFNDAGKLLKEYQLNTPPDTGVLCTCLSDNELYVYTFNQIIYKFIL